MDCSVIHYLPLNFLQATQPFGAFSLPFLSAPGFPLRISSCMKTCLERGHNSFQGNRGGFITSLPIQAQPLWKSLMEEVTFEGFHPG